MGLIAWEKKQMKNLDLWDIALIKLSVAAFILFVAKFWAQILSLSWHWYFAIFILAMIRPMSRFLKKR